MGCTPRFAEPGKEVVFATVVMLDGAPRAQFVQLQKRLGTGGSTKMWFAVAAAISATPC